MWGRDLLPKNETSATAGQRFFISKETKMPAKSLTCKECQATYPLDARYVCEQCFGPLEVAYDHSSLDDPAALRRKIQAGPASIWRYADFLPFARRPKTALDAGFTPLIRSEQLPARPPRRRGDRNTHNTP